jgi:hypothetical protein
LITIRNETTHSETITDTSEICEGTECEYHFSAPVRGLAYGANHITALVNGEETSVKIDVIRTALASSTSCSECCAAGSGVAGL